MIPGDSISFAALIVLACHPHLDRYYLRVVVGRYCLMVMVGLEFWMLSWLQSNIEAVTGPDADIRFLE